MKDVEKALFNLTKVDKLDNLDADLMDGLAEVAYQHVLRRPSDKFASRLKKGLEYFNIDELRKGPRGINALRLVASNFPGYKGFVSKFSTLQKYQNDPIGIIHTMRTLEKTGLDNVLAFERKMEDVFPDIATIKTTTGTNAVSKNRRVDAWVKDNRNIEMKGSVADPAQPFRMSNSADLEFLNDAIYFARAGQEFEWQIAKQLDISFARKRMKELLGNGNIPRGLDSRLKTYLKELRADSEEKYITMLDGLGELHNKVDAGDIIKNAEYID